MLSLASRRRRETWRRRGDAGDNLKSRTQRRSLECVLQVSHTTTFFCVLLSSVFLFFVFFFFFFFFFFV